MNFSLAPTSTGPAHKKLAFGFNKAKQTKLAAFADSDDDEPSAKRRRSGPEPDAGAARPPADPEVRKAVEKLAEYVAANGRSFEEVTRQRNPDKTSPFRFLFDKTCAEYKYYNLRVQQMEQARGSSSSAAAAAAEPSQPKAPSSRAHEPAEQSAPPSASGARPTRPDEHQPGAAPAQSADDSLAAMQRFERMAAEREREAAARRAQGDQQDGNRPPEEFLNETAYDRRKQMAVYKRDGTRAHHLTDYIPPDELMTFMAKSGQKEALEAAEQQQKISGSNIGHKLLSKMGWKEGEGLGASGSGIAAPVSAVGATARTNLGLGATDHSDPSTAADDFELYRKRMQLGYKYRPNPNGNPRREYNT